MTVNEQDQVLSTGGEHVLIVMQINRFSLERMVIYVADDLASFARHVGSWTWLRNSRQPFTCAFGGRGRSARSPVSSGTPTRSAIDRRSGGRQAYQKENSGSCVSIDVQNESLTEGITIMSGKTDKIKGRIKEAAGALTGSDKLKEEGKTDQVVGEAKEAVQKVADNVKKFIKKVTE